MAKSASRQFNWSRLIIVAALLVLAVVVWTRQVHFADAPAAVGTPAANPADTPAVVQDQGDPRDAPGWRARAEARFQAGQYAQAVAAYERAVALAPGDAMTWAALGEARVMASAHDPMPAEALKDFRQASAIDPKEPRTRYFLAVHQDLTGDHAGAIAAWLALLRDTPPGAPWEADLRRTITQVATIHHIAVAPRLAAIRQPAPALPAIPVPPAIAGPSDQELAAAASIPPSQQQAMAQGMVARLEQRLAADPHNGEGWALLIRSRMTLDGPGAGAAALARAVAADPADAAQLRAQAGAMGVR